MHVKYDQSVKTASRLAAQAMNSIARDADDEHPQNDLVPKNLGTRSYVYFGVNNGRRVLRYF